MRLSHVTDAVLTAHGGWGWGGGKGAGWDESWVKAQLKGRILLPACGALRSLWSEKEVSDGTKALSGDRQLGLTACHFSLSASAGITTPPSLSSPHHNSSVNANTHPCTECAYILHILYIPNTHVQAPPPALLAKRLSPANVVEQT